MKGGCDIGREILAGKLCKVVDGVAQGDSEPGVERNGHSGGLAQMRNGKRTASQLQSGRLAYRHQSSGCGPDMQTGQHPRIKLVPGLDFQNDLIIINRCEDCGGLPGAIRAIQGALDRRGSKPVCRSPIAVNL